MAQLTDQEVIQTKALLESYKNGKTVGELPSLEAHGNNIFVEAYDADSDKDGRVRLDMWAIGDLRPVFKGTLFDDLDYVKLDGSRIDIEDYPGLPDAMLAFGLSGNNSSSMKPSSSAEAIPTKGDFICMGDGGGGATGTKVVLIGNDGYVYYNNKKLGNIGSGFVRGQLLTGAKYGFYNDVFFVVALHAIYYSIDGISWSTLQTGSTLDDTVEDVVANFIADGRYTCIYLKVKRTSSPSYKYYEIGCRYGSQVSTNKEITPSPIDVVYNVGAFGNGTYVLKANTNNAIAISTNRVNWQVVETPRIPTFIGFANGLFVLVFNDTDVYTSEDCLTFNSVGFFGGGGNVTTLIYDDGYYILARPMNYFISKDGAAWRRYTSSTDNEGDHAIVCDGQIRLFCNHYSAWCDVYINESALKPIVVNFNTGYTNNIEKHTDWYYKFR